MNKKCAIATLYTGYNYGSALQAYATKTICKKMGYDAEVIKIKGITKGRDIRFSKILHISLKMIMHPTRIKRLKAYSKNGISAKTKSKFINFYDKNIKPNYVTYRELKKISKNDKYAFYICGSDQIWNSTIDYVDPFYYLRFAPKEKRIAFAPSFGRDYISEDNIKKISKYVEDIPFLSIREKSGEELIRKYTRRTALTLIDPTLVLDRKDWDSLIGDEKCMREKYALAYFLNNPGEKVKNNIRKYAKKNNCKVVWILNDDDKDFSQSVFENAGPIEFIKLVKYADHIFTDSYHGTIFSINYEKNFSVFKRNYGTATKQTTRIINLLELIGETKKYNPRNYEECIRRIDYEKAKIVLRKEREKSKRYLADAISEIQGGKNNV